MYAIFPAVTATKVQTAAYLVGVASFSISFLVFLNASISFVITDCIGQQEGVGDAVGTLGFADELLALAACPLWGLLSDRIGVRNVTVSGFCIIALSFFVLVQSRNVYPQLLLGRLLFSVGGAACSTMVTAILPALTMRRVESRPVNRPDESSTEPDFNVRHSGAFSVSSELTITPARYIFSPPSSSSGRQRTTYPQSVDKDQGSGAGTSSQLAGFVGLFTGIGALLAVAIFLPLPTTIAGAGTSKRDAVQYSFYIVACIALILAVLVYLGLRGLPGDEGKGFRNIYITPDRSSHTEASTISGADATPTPYVHLVKAALGLAFTDSRIALGYIGGFVARGSSVAISLFIPLFVNAYFIRNGLCEGDPGDDIKSKCRRAYTLASMLTGFAELAALLCAPLIGWVNSRLSKQESTANIPLSIGAVAGIAGAVIFGLTSDPDPFSGGGATVIISVILLGISQITAIVCSLGTLSRGIQVVAQPPFDNISHSDEPTPSSEQPTAGMNGHHESSEASPLLTRQPTAASNQPIDRVQLKGTIAGVYSLLGGVGILVLTKLGGFLFDKTHVGAPFFVLAGYNGSLLAAVAIIAAAKYCRGMSRTATS
ncbi:hypothetical protein AAFC00_001373 [Neodothiora populina]|uniref:MFS transporter n=1 Tax=Neodothiora populina TaxID=2781224 RepID=A0ABR3PNR2_9PEZI